MGVLPFLTTGALTEQGGGAVAGAEAVPCSVWPAESSRNGRTGRVHSHTGEASIDFAEALRVPNRLLVVDGVRYRIQSATPHELLPHVGLELTVVSGKS